MKTITKSMVAIGFAVACLPALANNSAFESGMVEATGFGTVDMTKVASKVQAKMMTKRAAQVDAQRQLAERIRGIRLTAGTTVEDYEVTSDIVATRVKGSLQGAFIVDSKVYEEEGSFVAEMTMAVCLFAKDPRCQSKPSFTEQLKEVMPKPAPAESFTPKAPVTQNYSTFVLDARKQPYAASLITQVFDDSGKLVLSSDELEKQQNKMLVWSSNPSEYAGAESTTIKVQQVANQSNLVLTSDDANQLYHAMSDQAKSGRLVILSD